MSRILCQEQLLPGLDLLEKWDHAQRYGFDGIELRGRGDRHLEARLPELKAAAKSGAVLPTVSVDMPHFVGSFDDALREDAIEQMRSQLAVVADLGGTGAVTPASSGMFSRRLPPFEPPRSPSEDLKVLEDSFGLLADHAASLGVVLLLSPVNGYEDHMVNRLCDAVSLIETIDSDALRLAAGSFHMSIEEADPAAALHAAAPYLAHVQVSDSNRLEPGAGHLDWPLFCGTLTALGYEGDLALEGGLSGHASDVLHRVPTLLRRFL
ncbi:MAG: sugar phosphate isomerase/epimerase family protein [Nocardioidaceae bacterium]